MKKILCTTIMLAMAVTLLFTVSASANFGSGVEVISEGTPIIKTGLYGKKLTFSDNDIKQGLCITDFDSITITKIPASTEGSLMLMGKRVGENQTIKRRNIASLVFIPASQDTEGAAFSFTVSPYEGTGEIEFILKFTDKINCEPTVSPEYIESAAISTQRDVARYGNLYASDPEGDKIEFIILSYPKGSLVLTDKQSGKYKYTPAMGYTGEDSFIYVARDEWGNYSVPVTVDITVEERICETVLYDMKDCEEYNEALCVTAAGIMGGTLIGESIYFMPDDEVTRAEFVAMAMIASGTRRDSTLTQSSFDDNGEIPAPLVGYVATAQRCGIINGVFDGKELLFSPNESITLSDAAKIISKLKNLNASMDVEVFAEIGAVPLSKRAAVAAMYEYGYFDSSVEPSSLEANLTRAECAVLLCKMMK